MRLKSFVAECAMFNLGLMDLTLMMNFHRFNTPFSDKKSISTFYEVTILSKVLSPYFFLRHVLTDIFGNFIVLISLFSRTVLSVVGGNDFCRALTHVSSTTTTTIMMQAKLSFQEIRQSINFR